MYVNNALASILRFSGTVQAKMRLYVNIIDMVGGII